MGNIPLYQHDKIHNMPDFANAGLWYDKFCDQWSDGWEKLGDRKKNWIDTVAGKKIGNIEEINMMVERIKRMVENLSGKNLLFITDSRFVTGLGRNHPVENGFTWHHTLGTPFIPGSSIKGVVRDWARNLETVDNDQMKRIFGPVGNKDEHSVGSIIFLDAIPTSRILLTSDIMTPHYGEYYSSKGKEIPGDWDNPTPVPFLVVDTGQEFLFGLIPRNEEAKKDLDMVEKWLVEALEWSGAGAKTNVGYGRFVHIEIKSPVEEWLIKTANEVAIAVDKITTNPSHLVIERWIEIVDLEFKMLVAKKLKERIIKENNWDGKRWGQLEKLKTVLKEYIGE